MRNARNECFAGVEIEYLGGIESIEKQETITGSCTLFSARDLKGNTIKIIIDAGMHQGGKKEKEKNADVDERILTADHLIVTHAHIDHIGKIPFLVKKGFRGKIHMSPTTKQIAIESLKDSARVMKREYEETLGYNKKVGPLLKAMVKLKKIEETLQKNGINKADRNKLEQQKLQIGKKYTAQELKIHRDKYPHIQENSDIAGVLRPPTPPLYSLEDVLQIVPMIESLDIGQKKSLSFESGTGVSDISETPTIDGLSVCFHNAGHIAGSVQAEISIRISRIINGAKQLHSPQDTQEEKIYLFSGDLGRMDTGNVSGPPSITQSHVDYAQVESTYAGKNHPDRWSSHSRLIEIIQNAPGKIIIPCFAVQRSQEILLLLLKHAGELGISPGNIILDSPLASLMTDVYINNIGEPYSLLDPAIQRERLGKVYVKRLTEKNAYKKLYSDRARNTRQIIISSGGMCQGGAIISHLKQNLSNPNSTIVFIGYTPENTLGKQIKNATQEVSIEGNTYPINCHVHDIAGFSGHIGHDEIVQYCSEIHFRAGAILALTHGGESRSKLSSEIQSPKKGGKVTTPQVGDTVKLTF